MVLDVFAKRKAQQCFRNFREKWKEKKKKRREQKGMRLVLYIILNLFFNSIIYKTSKVNKLFG